MFPIFPNGTVGDVPIFPNGSVATLADVPRFPNVGDVSSRRRPANEPVRVRRTEVAENWQLVCANSAARLPPQRLVGDEQKIAACLERCSQKLIRPDGKDLI